MTQAYLAVEKPEKAVTAQEMLTELQPKANTFSNLAILSYQAGQTRKGDLAAAKAVELTEGADDKKQLKEQLEQAKTQSITQQIQEAVTPTPTVKLAPKPRRYYWRPRALVAQLAEQRTLDPKG